MVRSTSAGPAGNDEAWQISGAVSVGLTAWGITYAALTWSGQDAPADPASIVFAIVAGDLAWSATTTSYAAGLAAAVLAVAVAAGFLIRLLRDRPVPADRAARHMATRRDVDALTFKPTSRRARSLAPALGRDAVGLPIGNHLPSKTRLYSSWEDMWVLVAGPRTMKSSTYTIPLALAAPRACLIAENKRGVLDHTRGPRRSRRRLGLRPPGRRRRAPPILVEPAGRRLTVEGTLGCYGHLGDYRSAPKRRHHL